VPSAPKHAEIATARKGDLARTDTSRTAQDKSRTNSDQTLQLLVEELEDLGRNQRSIAPAALTGRSCLFACLAVKSRVGQQATKERLQQAAHDALEDALAALPTPDDQLIGQAILAATDEFVGKDVNTRKRVLDEKHGIDVGRFKRRRPMILRLLAEHLLSTEAEDTNVSDYRKSLHNLTCLFEDAANLGLYCLAYEFVTDFDTRLTASDGAPQHLRRRRASITEPFYDNYRELILSTGCCLGEAPYSCRTTILSVMPTEVVPEIARLLDGIFDALPLEAQMRIEFCHNHYAFPPDLYVYRSRLSMRRRVWNNWERNILTFDATNLRVLRPIVTACKALLQYVHDSLNINLYNRPPHSQVQAVADYYGVEPTCIFNNKSLDEHCQDYLFPDDPRRYYELLRM
jgi:hypothetical protein